MADLNAAGLVLCARQIELQFDEFGWTQNVDLCVEALGDYKQRHPDLAGVLGDNKDYIRHYINHGYFEGRKWTAPGESEPSEDALEQLDFFYRNSEYATAIRLLDQPDIEGSYRAAVISILIGAAPARVAELFAALGSRPGFGRFLPVCSQPLRNYVTRLSPHDVAVLIRSLVASSESEHFQEFIRNLLVNVIAIDPRSDITNVAIELICEWSSVFAKLERGSGNALTLNVYVEQLKEFYPPLGTISRDLSAVVGKNGWLFLFGGGNDYYRQYATTAVDAQGIADEWLELYRCRESKIRELGVRPVQIILPNKIGRYRDHFPFPTFDRFTGAFRAIHDVLPEFALADLFDATVEDVFYKADSHLNIYGNHVLYRWLLRRMGVDNVPIPYATTSKKMLKLGDLGNKFEPNILEVCSVPDLGIGRDRATKIFERVPPKGGNVGYRAVWRNEHAPIDRRVCVFGNSFFERGQFGTLSWFMKETFSWFCFNWTDRVEYSLIKKDRYDFVIAQTIERFLPRVPTE